jgi:peptidoglycan/LPS O-acetylase OafA/YrhL
MFRSPFQDHLQGSSFALSASTTLQLHASSLVCIGMWSYALYLYVYPVYLPVCFLVVLCTTRKHTGTGIPWITIKLLQRDQ